MPWIHAPLLTFHIYYTRAWYGKLLIINPSSCCCNETIRHSRNRQPNVARSRLQPSIGNRAPSCLFVCIISFYHWINIYVYINIYGFFCQCYTRAWYGKFPSTRTCPETTSRNDFNEENGGWKMASAFNWLDGCIYSRLRHFPEISHCVIYADSERNSRLSFRTCADLGNAHLPLPYPPPYPPPRTLSSRILYRFL